MRDNNKSNGGSSSKISRNAGGTVNDSDDDGSEAEWTETPSHDSQAVADLVSTMKRTSSEDFMMNN